MLKRGRSKINEAELLRRSLVRVEHGNAMSASGNVSVKCNGSEGGESEILTQKPRYLEIRDINISCVDGEIAQRACSCVYVPNTRLERVAGEIEPQNLEISTSAENGAHAVAVAKYCVVIPVLYDGGLES